MKKKYIIELEDKPFHNGNGDFLYRVKGFNSLVFDMTGVGKLTPYTEPDLEQVRKEAFKNGYDAACKDIDIKSKINAAYRKGLEDAWEAARKVVALSTVDRREVFGSEYMYSILEKHTAAEAIEKIRQYEQEEIKVGDEVKGKYGTTAGMLGIVTRIDDAIQNYNVVWSDGSTICFTGYRERGDVVKTGRHFPEIAETLQKMKEKQHDGNK